MANTGGTLTLNNCTVSSNFAGTGGGLYNARSSTSNSTLIVRNSFISNNANGGISNAQTATLTNCTVSGNTSNGGISSNGTLSLSNCTVSNNSNSSGFGGGGLTTNGGTSTVRNCTFAGNTSTSTGGSNITGGIYNNFSATLVIGNTILNNTGGNLANRDTSATITDEGYNLANDGGNGFLTAPTDKLSTNPQLGPLQFNGGPTPTHALLAGSPAIDAGNATGTDQRGVARPFDDPNIANAANGSDIGSFERAPDTAQSGLSFVVTTPDDHDDGTCGTTDCTLREAIGLANISADANIITFDSTVFGSRQSIALRRALPLISNTLEINGPASGVTLVGTGGSIAITTATNGNLTLSNFDLNGSGFPSLQNNGTLTLLSSRIRGSGTSFINTLRARATVQNTIVQNNTTGIDNDGDLTVQNSTLSGNGLAVQSRNIFVLDSSTMANNGDGVRAVSGTVRVQNSTFVGNTNAILSNTAALQVISATISGNGGSISNASGTLSVRSSIVAGNGNNIQGTLNNSAFNILNATPAQAGLETDSNGFPVLKNNGGPTQTVALVARMEGGAAINTGDPTLSFPTDQRGTGFPRVQKGRADIGAFESNISARYPFYFSLVVTTTADEDNGSINPAAGSGTSLREAINAANQNGSGLITFDATVFGSRQTIALNGTALPTLLTGLTIIGPSVGVEIQGNGAPNILSAARRVNVDSGIGVRNLTLSGATIGIDNQSLLYLTNVKLSNTGIGLLNRAGSSTSLADSVVQNNGTGIQNEGTLDQNTVSLDVSGTNFVGNTFCLQNQTGARAFIAKSGMAGNSVGIQNQGTLFVEHSTIAGNGDGVRNSAGATASLTQSTFVNNTYAVLSNNATLSVSANTIAGNGAGLVNNGGTMNVRNTLSVGNGTNVSGALASNAFNILSGTPAQAGLETDGNGFPVLKNNGGPTATVALVAGGQAINAGDPAITTGTDQRGTGFPRVQKGRADIGAFESSLGSASLSLVVTTTADEDNGSSNPSSGSGTSLREAINAANANGNGTITFDAGVFGTRQTISLNASKPLPAIAGDISIIGSAAGVAVDGNNGSVVLPIQSGTVNLARLSFSRANVGINNGGTLLFVDGNLSQTGVGLLNGSGATATLQNSMLQSNGTGIQNAGRLMVQKSGAGNNTFGLVNESSAAAALQNCNLFGNAAGIQNTGQLSLANSTLAGNGDALREGASSNLVQNTFVSNTNAVLLRGGATIFVNDCTLSGNGGGLVNNGGQMNVTYTISAGNGTNVSGTLSTNTSNILSGTPAQAGLQTDGNGFPVLRDNGGPTPTVALVAGSPAINAGDPSLAGTDQRGFPRQVGGRSDIGAFEFQSSTASALRKSLAPKKSAPSS